MDRLPYATPPRWWSPRLRPFLIRLLRRARVRRVRRREHLVDVEVRGLENLRQPLDQRHGVLITSKHVGHVDHYVCLAAGDALGRPFYYMAGWQVFQLLRPLERWVIRRHGCFSVDREGTDLRAFRQAVEILQKTRHPLVMFPEGEIYHNNEWVFPFRVGTATIALTAARRGSRPVSCVPAAIKYEYVEDPTPRLRLVLDDLERRLSWPPRPDLSLARRIRDVAEGVVALREVQHLGRARPGPLPDRIDALMETILSRVEERQGARPGGANVPERVTPLRQQAIKKKESVTPEHPLAAEAARDLADLEMVVQLYSYTHDYTSEDWSLERMAEIVDKLEEDVLGAPTASIRGDRRAVIAFGAPIEVRPQGRKKDEARALTAVLEEAVQGVLDGLYSRPAVLQTAHDSEGKLGRRV